MAIHAYAKAYVGTMQTRLAHAFDYAIRQCGVPCDEFAAAFARSSCARALETGRVAEFTGKSGYEIARTLEISFSTQRKRCEIQRSPEYWAGWALVRYQWETGRRFQHIFEKAPLSKIISMYPVYHEMDVSKFCETMNEWLAGSRLRQAREFCHISREQLAKLSGVSVHTIRAYETGVNDIYKAEVGTLLKLARTFGCSIEDLLN